MMIKFKCLHCGQSISADLEEVGEEGNCPNCDAPIVILGPSDPPPPSPLKALAVRAVLEPLSILPLRKATPPPEGPVIFCRTCGKALSPNAFACTQCGCPPASGNEFCPGCGAKTLERAIICVKCGIGLQSATVARRTGGSDFSRGERDPQEITQRSRRTGDAGFSRGERELRPPPQTGGTQPINKTTLGILALLLGGIGAHKFYAGNWGWGILYLLFCWTFIPAIVATAEGIRYLTMPEADFQQAHQRVAEQPFGFLW